MTIVIITIAAIITMVAVLVQWGHATHQELDDRDRMRKILDDTREEYGP